MDVKISELEPVDSLYGGCCFPLVSKEETKKVTYDTLKGQLKEDIKTEDTGWIDLTLASGVSAKVAQYRKIGNVVYLQIVNLTGYKLGENSFAVLPKGFIPTDGFRKQLSSTGTTVGRLQVVGINGINTTKPSASRPAGNLEIYNNTSGSNAWVDIIISFPVD